MSGTPHVPSFHAALGISDDRLHDLAAVLDQATDSSVGPAISDSLQYLETVEDLADIERLYLAYQLGRLAEKINQAVPSISAISGATVYDSLGIPPGRWSEVFEEVKAHGLADPDETVRWIRDHPVFADSEKMSLTVAIVRMRDLGFWEAC